MAVAKQNTSKDPLWFKDAIVYQAHVKTFFDSNSDGIGDFRGLVEKLDYLVDLGVTALWILPFYPSPLKDDGYDIADYCDVHPAYGNLQDFKVFLKEAHRRGLRVITELVINHTSDQNPWFQRSRKSPPGSAWRNFYVWSDAPDKYLDARIIFKDFEHSNWSYDPEAKAYYWHRFYHHQPDLNFESRLVQREVFRALDFWLSMGVDGLRLDAIPYLFEQDGTNCENLDATHEYLKKLRNYVDTRYTGKMLLAEANQWPEDAVSYFGNADECHMCFHFPLMPRMFMALQLEDSFPIIDILEQTPQIPESCQWATFLRNHDELTLEMVTDEERDYMYRVYARDPKARINLGIRRRLAPLLENDRRKIEVMNILLMSLPGTPILYYGDEIGMGDNYYLGDRNGVRTPMQWSPDKNAGFSKGNPQQLYLPVTIDPEYHYESINVENQEKNTSSLLWWMRRMISSRKRFLAFSRGDLKFYHTDNPKVIAFTRSHGGETVLTIVNLSRFTQITRLDLREFQGCMPEEVISQNPFPIIGEDPYVFMLSPYGYYWLKMQRTEQLASRYEEWDDDEIDIRLGWKGLLAPEGKAALENEILPRYIRNARWFGGKSRSIRKLSVVDNIPIQDRALSAQLLIVDIQYTEGLSDSYFLPLLLLWGEEATRLQLQQSSAILASFDSEKGEGVLADALYEEEFRDRLLQIIARKKVLKGQKGRILGEPAKLLKDASKEKSWSLTSNLLKGEQSNSSIVYQNQFILKLYRRVESGLNPDLELTQQLEVQRFEHVPAYAGSILYRRDGMEPSVMGLIQAFTPNQGDAWTLTLNELGQYFDRALAHRMELKDAAMQPGSPRETLTPGQLDSMQELLGGRYSELSALLGKRTAEMHKALAADPTAPAFAPEGFSTLYQRSVYQSIRGSVIRILQMLEKNRKRLPERARLEADRILDSKPKIMNRLRQIYQLKITTSKIRIHGDYHLGQVLFTGRDFHIIDFEGEPARALSERKLKRSPLRDVAGMLRSFHYAAYCSILQSSNIREEDHPFMEPWADVWYQTIGHIFLDSYLETARGEKFVPVDEEQLKVLLDAFLLDKAFYEVGYELNNRPDWALIPLVGINQIIQEGIQT